MRTHRREIEVEGYGFVDDVARGRATPAAGQPTSGKGDQAVWFLATGRS